MCVDILFHWGKLLCSRALQCVPLRMIIQEGRIASSLLWKPSPWEGASSWEGIQGSASCSQAQFCI